MTMDIARLADHIGELAQIVLNRAGGERDCYIIITSRNVPPPGTGSNQAMATNIPDADVPGVLRFLADEMEAGRNIAFGVNDEAS